MEEDKRARSRTDEVVDDMFTNAHEETLKHLLENERQWADEAEARLWPSWAPPDVIDEWEDFQYLGALQENDRQLWNEFLGVVEADTLETHPSRVDKIQNLRESFDEYLNFSMNKPDHDIIKKMLTDHRMKEVWEGVEAAGNNDPLGFAQLVGAVYMKALQVSEKMTPKKSAAQLDKIKQKAKELSELLEGNVLDGFLALDLQEWLDQETIRSMSEMKITGTQPLPSPTRDYYPPKLSYILQRLSNEAESYGDRLSMSFEDDDVEVGRPNREDAPRVYFARSITK